MSNIKRIWRNFFHENKSTFNGLFLLFLAFVVYKYGGFDDTTTGLLVSGFVAAALKFLTGSDAGTKPPQQ